MRRQASFLWAPKWRSAVGARPDAPAHTALLADTGALDWLNVTETVPGLIRIVGTEAVDPGKGRAQGRALCIKLQELLGCEGGLDLAHLPKRCNAARQVPALIHPPPAPAPTTPPHTTRRPTVATTRPPVPSKPHALPLTLCTKVEAAPAFEARAGSGAHGPPQRGWMLAAVPDCDPQRLWGERAEWENHGWYKCRNTTHWLTGCRRYPPRV